MYDYVNFMLIEKVKNLTKKRNLREKKELE
jgi:hypothetical protein